MRNLLESPVGQAVLAFVRVFTATLLACWLEAGTPVRNLTEAIVVGWVELGLTAALGLVLANYFGPWESRYGISGKQPD